MKKILITYATYGTGHKSIAGFIQNYLQKNSDYEIKLVDIMDYTNRFCNFSLKAFNYVYKHRMEFLFSTIYKALDNRFSGNLYNIYLKKFILNKKIEKLYCEYKPDLVLSTHFYGSSIACSLNKKGFIKSKVMTILTDYKSHDFWLSNNDPNEIFIVANEIVKQDIIHNHCKTKKIYPFGLPFNIELLKKVSSKESIYKKYNINPKNKVILFYAGGGNGNIAYIKYYKEILKLNLKNIEIVFISGKNKEVELEALKVKRKYNAEYAHILGFINNVYELLCISNFVISKPGAATITECIETKKTMLLLPGIGGQEKYNARFVCKNGYGLKTRFLFSFKKKFANLINDPNEMFKYQKNYENNNKNESLEKIAKLISEILK